jgi:hypothetical protein
MPHVFVFAPVENRGQVPFFLRQCGNTNHFLKKGTCPPFSTGHSCVILEKYAELGALAGT